MIYKNPLYFNQKKGKYGRTNTRAIDTRSVREDCNRID